MNTEQIISSLGGDDAIAEEISCRPVSIRSWRSRGWIPRRWWPELIDMAKRKRVAGINHSSLKAAEAEAKGKVKA
jgi:uncharacterized protein YjcR